MAHQGKTPEDEALRFNLGRAVLFLENALGRMPQDLSEPADPALSRELEEALESLHQALQTPRTGGMVDLEDTLASAAARQGLREPAVSEESLDEDDANGLGEDMDSRRQIVASLNRIHADLGEQRDELGSNLRWTIASVAGGFILLGGILITGLLLLDERMRAIEAAVWTLAN